MKINNFSFLFGFSFQSLVIFMLYSKQYDILYKGLVISDRIIAILVLNILLTSILTLKSSKSVDGGNPNIVLNSIPLIGRISSLFSIIGAMVSTWFYRSFFIERDKLDFHLLPFNFTLKRNWSREEMAARLKELLQERGVPFEDIQLLRELRGINSMDQVRTLSDRLESEYFNSLVEPTTSAASSFIYKVCSLPYDAVSWCWNNGSPVVGVLIVIGLSVGGYYAYNHMHNYSSLFEQVKGLEADFKRAQKLAEEGIALSAKESGSITARVGGLSDLLTKNTSALDERLTHIENFMLAISKLSGAKLEDDAATRICALIKHSSELAINVAGYPLEFDKIDMALKAAFEANKHTESLLGEHSAAIEFILAQLRYEQR